MFKQFIAKLRSDRFYFDSFVLTFFTVLGNAFAFFVNIIYTRFLPLGQYGAVMSINSIINILGTIAISFRMFNVKETTGMISRGEFSKAIVFSYKFALYSFIFMLVFFVLSIPFYPIIMGFINVDSYLVLIIAITIVIFTYLTSITSSLYQSLKMFLALGIINFSYPFLRFVITYPYLVSWKGYIGATASMLVGIMLSFVISSIILLYSREIRNLDFDSNQKIEFSYFLPLIPIVLINVFYSVLNYADVIFSRRYFSPEDTDIFAIASTVAKANLFVVIPISYVVLPRMIDDYIKSGYKASIVALFKGVLLSFIVCLIYGVFILLFGDLVLRIFGERYLLAKDILWFFTFAFIPLAVSFILINYAVAFKNWYLLIPLGLTDIILILGFVFFHGNFYEMILVDLVAGLFLFIFSLIVILVSKEPPVLDKEEVISEEANIQN
ncbi:MAG: hypothetical protein ACP5KI_03165 [Brevinematia bacterium]